MRDVMVVVADGRHALARVLGALALLTLSALPASSQPVKVVDLAPVSAKSTITFGSVLNVVELPDGKIAVNDASSRHLYLLDRSLAMQKVILDSAMTTTSYGRGSVSLLFCNCGEIWFPDRVSRSILVFDQAGNQTRVMSAPRPGDLGLISSNRTIADTLGRLFYRGAPPPTPLPAQPVRAGIPQVNPDSTALLRANFDTRNVDTIAKLRSLRNWTLYSGPKGSDGQSVTHIAVDILASIDEWTLTADGSVAIVRGHDYHVDWLLPDGRTVSSPKLPFDFKRLTDTDKAALMDSARKAEIGARRAQHEKEKANGGFRFTGPDGREIVLKTGEFVEPIVDSIPFERIPDYYPPIREGAVTADLEGNVWILPTTSAQSRAGELVYDVVNRERGLVTRVRLPVGRSLAGFGKNGTVYLTSRDGDGRWSVERTLVVIVRTQ